MAAEGVSIYTANACSWDPNGWFHVRVVVASPKVSVFVEDAKEPSLIVSQLSERGKGLIGLWVGNNSGGDFANLRLIPA